MGFNTSSLWRILTKDRYESNDPPADYKSIVQDIENRAAGAARLVADVAARDAIPAGQLYNQMRVITLADGIEWRRIGTAWKGWDSWWQTAAPNITGLNGGQGQAPGYISNGRYRYRGGSVLWEWAFLLNGATAAATGNLLVSTPVVMDSTEAFGGKRYNLPRGTVSLFDDSDGGREYRLGVKWYDNATIALSTQTSATGRMDASSVSSPVTFVQSDVFQGALEFDPA